MSDPKDAESVEQDITDEALDIVSGGATADPRPGVIVTNGYGGTG